MKILLDENIDVRFKLIFSNTIHDVYTVKDMQWNGVKNGKLLQLLKENDFYVLIAVDKNLPYQQNKELLPICIIIPDVKRNTLQNLLLFSEVILSMLNRPQDNKVVVLKLN